MEQCRCLLQKYVFYKNLLCNIDIEHLSKSLENVCEQVNFIKAILSTKSQVSQANPPPKVSHLLRIISVHFKRAFKSFSFLPSKNNKKADKLCMKFSATPYKCTEVFQSSFIKSMSPFSAAPS